MEYGFYSQPPLAGQLGLYDDAVIFHGVSNQSAASRALARVRVRVRVRVRAVRANPKPNPNPYPYPYP